MRVTIIKGLVLTAFLLLACAHVRDATRAAGSQASRAKAIFEERCARCHGRDGRGRTKLGEMLDPPDFTHAGWQKSVGDGRLTNSIRDGVGEMPAFKRKLSNREIDALVAYVRAFAKPER